MSPTLYMKPRIYYSRTFVSTFMDSANEEPGEVGTGYTWLT